jgi:hypothetical protein
VSLSLGGVAAFADFDSNARPGGDGACALLADRTIRCRGGHQSGRLGIGTTTGPDCGGACSATPVPVVGITNATQVSAGGVSTCASLADGTIRCWGKGLDGKLGDGSTSDSSVPVTVSGIPSPWTSRYRRATVRLHRMGGRSVSAGLRPRLAGGVNCSDRADGRVDT